MLGPFLGAFRSAKIIALHQIATILAQEIGLANGFNAFGNHLEFETMSQRQRSQADRRITLIGFDILHKRTISL